MASMLQLISKPCRGRAVLVLFWTVIAFAFGTSIATVVLARALTCYHRGISLAYGPVGLQSTKTRPKSSRQGLAWRCSDRLLTGPFAVACQVDARLCRLALALRRRRRRRHHDALLQAPDADHGQFSVDR